MIFRLRISIRLVSSACVALCYDRLKHASAQLECRDTLGFHNTASFIVCTFLAQKQLRNLTRFQRSLLFTNTQTSIFLQEKKCVQGFRLTMFGASFFRESLSLNTLFFAEIIYVLRLSSAATRLI